MHLYPPHSAVRYTVKLSEEDLQRTGIPNAPFARGESPRYSRPDEG